MSPFTEDDPLQLTFRTRSEGCSRKDAKRDLPLVSGLRGPVVALRRPARWQSKTTVITMCRDGPAFKNAWCPMSEATRLLSAIEHGDPRAAEQLLPLVYDELRKLAAQKLAREKPGQTLEATGLVHEAYLRLVGADQAQYWNSRGHFFAAAAEAMRRILIENAAPQESR